MRARPSLGACLVLIAACGGSQPPPQVETGPSPAERAAAADAAAKEAAEKGRARAANQLAEITEKVRAGVETRCNPGWCFIRHECVKRDADVPSCVAQIATRNALYAAFFGGAVSTDCETLPAEDDSGWNTKLSDADQEKAPRVPCDTDSHALKCHEVRLQAEERVYCLGEVVAAGKRRAEKHVAAALEACVTAFAEAAATPASPPTCQLDTPPAGMSKEDLAPGKASCDTACAARAPEARKKYLADAPKRAANAPKCRRCFLAPASEAKGLEAWCDARVAASEYQGLIGPKCDSTCANKRAYDLCVKRP